MSKTLYGLAPLVSTRTRLLILGSFPSAASLKAQQYYAHPRNQFWKVMSILLDQDIYTQEYSARCERILCSSVVIWDVYAACEREGSLDSAIEKPVLNDFATLLKRYPNIEAAVHNGGESARNRKHLDALGLIVHQLPSTSPANASWSLQRKVQAWRTVLTPYLNDTKN
jgi:double-stranded uracil-DNA glycosylase